ncbi:MAG: sulfotransferase [Desulfovermiculus sp.]
MYTFRVKRDMYRQEMQYKPLIIIGAPRSGTNMLRDVLTSLPAVATWPCDEINYIWWHGNVRYPSDEFTPDMARPEVRGYIRRQFDWVAKKYQAQTVVEKTCANSLRVGFVDKVVPEAKYVFIRRDGLDAVGSAVKRWKAKLDIPYLARKARFVPLTDLPYYGIRYFVNLIPKMISSQARVSFWGPKLDGMGDLLARYSLEEVCAIQWKRCVDNAALALAHISEKRWIEVGYEDFVRNPGQDLQRIIDFLGFGLSSNTIEQAVMNVYSKSIGKGRKMLGTANSQRLIPQIQDTMKRYGYS